MTEQKPHVVIVGAGFGGIQTAKLLAKENITITIVDRQNFHLFQPLLYQLSTSVLSTDDIAYPIRAFFHHNPNVDLFMAKAEGIDTKRKVLLTNHGELSYDYLVLAAGATTNYFGMETVEQNSFPMKTLQDALHIRNHVLHMFERANMQEDEEERRRMLTFVCVGGGPTGVEEAGALTELIHLMRKEYHNINFDEVSVKLVEATDKLLPMMPPELRDETVRVLRKKGVDVMLSTQVADCDGESLVLKGGVTIPTHTVIWAAGVKAVPLMTTLGAKMDRADRVIVDKTLQVPGHPEIFAIGDNAHFEQDGRPLATVAPVATHQAVMCAKNIKILMQGGQKLELFAYHDLGSMATIGRGDAVLARGNFKMSGFFAWSAWLIVHLMRLAGIHTNIIVTFKWAWNYLSGMRLGRIITNIDI